MLNFNVTNIANNSREIYVWHRIGKTLSCFKDKTFFPYFYQISPTGIFKTIDNQKVNKIICSRPSDLKNRRDENSYEADINFCKRYIIDKITAFGKADIKYSFIDIEVLTKELPNYLYPEQPISCISCSNNYTGDIKTFWLKDYEKNHTVNSELEIELLNAFVDFIRKEQFDMILGWNFIEFDWRYLQARYKKLFDCELSDMLSPIARSSYLGSAKNEVIPNLVPCGLSVMDYLDMYKKIYRTEPSYALDAVCQKELNEAKYQKVDFSRLSDEIKEKNINDVRRMIEIDKKLKIIDYYDELRRMSMCEWADVTWNSKMLDIILLKEAKNKGIILPSKHYGEGIEIDEIGFEGAYRRCDTGLYKNLWKLDLSSAYPMAIINFCLDIANIRTNEGITINKVKFYQNSGALLPTIAQKLINKKDVLKKQLAVMDPESLEAKYLQVKYDAIKAVVNSLFGVCGLKIFRLFDYRVAASITFLIRDLLHYVEDKLKEKGINVIYMDTDSVFIAAPESPLELCNDLIKQWAKQKYGKDKIDIEFDLEGQFEKIFIIALCHYKGYLKKAKTGKIKSEIKGIEAKRKDSSIFIKKFQEELIEKVMNEEPKEEIIKWINKEKERIKTLPLIDVGYPCRISQKEGYKSIPIFLRGLEYTQELIKFEKNVGDSFYWIPVIPFGKAIRKSSRNKKNKETGETTIQSSEKEVNKDILCFDEDNYTHIKEINWSKIIDKSIIDKTEHIFEALKWDFTEIKPAKVKKERKKEFLIKNWRRNNGK